MLTNTHSPFVARSLHDLDGLERYMFLGDVVTLLLSSDDADGQLTLHEAASVYREGVSMRTHIHPEQTQYCRVMEGCLGYRVGDYQGVAEPGEIIVMPAGVPHRTWVAQPGQCRLLVLTSPGGLDDTFRRFGTPADAGARPTIDVTEAQVDELCERLLETDTSIVPQMCE